MTHPGTKAFILSCQGLTRKSLDCFWGEKSRQLKLYDEKNIPQKSEFKKNFYEKSYYAMIRSIQYPKALVPRKLVLFQKGLLQHCWRLEHQSHVAQWLLASFLVAKRRSTWSLEQCNQSFHPIDRTERCPWVFDVLFGLQNFSFSMLFQFHKVL